MTKEQAEFLYSIADSMGTTGIEDFSCKDGEKMREIIKALEQQPSAEERKVGKWKSDGHGHIFCTACNEVNVSLWKSKYCPCCGAEMVGVENG